MSKDIKEFMKYYIGCEVAELPKGKHDGMFIDRVTSVGEDGSVVTSNGIMFEAGEVKPILRKLESMTEEEATELNDVMWGGFPDAWEPRDELLKSFLYPWDSEYRPAFPVYVKAINWFRSKGFDCDELIENGLAIDKETLKG